MQVQLIYAHDRNLAVGYQNDMPWKRSLPEDLVHFKAQTLHQVVIMGRKTWESLPETLRPLPHRDNLVLSRNPDWKATGAQVFPNLPQALAARTHAPTVWIIGGASLYQEALPLARQILATEIDAEFAADAFAPSLSTPWQARPTIWRTAASGLRYRFVTWQRTTPDIPASGTPV